MEFDYGYEYYFPDAVEGAAEGLFVCAAGIITGILMILWLIAMAFCIVSYVLNAVGLYRIAKRRGIHHAWLAWVPIGVCWLLGSISDHYQYFAKQKQTSRRKILLILCLILAAVSIVFSVGAVVLGVSAGTVGGSVMAVALMVISYLAMTGLAIAVTVFCYIAYYDLFRSCKPKNDVLFLVLGILVNVTLPFFVFACSNSDEGMPPRRVQQPPVQFPYEPELPAEEEVPAEEEAAVEEAPFAEEEIPVVEGEIVEDPE